MLRHIPHIALMRRPELTGGIQAASKSQRPYLFACTFYGITPTVKAPSPNGSFNIPFASAFESLITLSIHFAQSLINGSGSPSFLREVFSQSLLLVDRLVGRLGSSIVVLWDPKKWLSVVLGSIGHEV
jgi:hypothetical protein